MQWVTFVVMAGILLAFILLKRVGGVSDDQARTSVAEGAVVVDVRSRAEYASEHWPRAINIPLNELEERIGREVPDKQKVVLLHCASGGRSGVGCAKLKRLGYAKAFNLGSYGRAGKILSAAGA